MASTDPSGTASSLSPLVLAAARGELPAWAEVTPPRRAHISRVAELLGRWAEDLALPREECTRWLAAAWLHDSLRDADAARLRDQVPEAFRTFPPLLLHGPAAAERLAGQADASLLMAIRYHTIGHPDLDLTGRALYLADFLEPGRDFAVVWTASLRARMPHDMPAVLLEVIGARLRHLIEVRRPIRPETAAFWSVTVGGE